MIPSLLLVLGCSRPSPGTASKAEDTVPAAEDTAIIPDDASGVYDQTVLHEVLITLSDADWAALRAQTRSIYALLDGEDCMSKPWGSPYTYFQGDVTFDGEDLGTVGVRKKGLMGSASLTRPSFRLDTDHYQDGARFHGLEKLVLNNNNQDESRLRTCLAHGFFSDAGLVAPRCSLAHVVVNGEDLGIYDNTEATDTDLIKRVTGSKPRTLYEGTLSDFRTDYLGTFDPKTEESDGADLAAVVTALEADDDTVISQLDQVIDLDNFFAFWAAEGLTGHWDGYNGNTNNYYVYGEQGDGRLHFIASGPDATFDSRTPFGADAPAWVATASALSNRLIQIPEGAARYQAAMQALLRDTWDPDAELASIDAWTELTGAYSNRAQRQAISGLREIITAKAGDIEAGLGEDVTPSALRGNPCFVPIGTVHVDFTTTFGSYPNGDVMTGGTASTEYVISDQTYTSLQDGVSAGWTGDGTALWLTVSEIAANTYLGPYVTFDPSQLVDGTDIPIDGYAAQAMLMYNAPETDGAWTTAAYMGNGSLRLDRAGSADGDTLSGALDVEVLTSGG